MEQVVLFGKIEWILVGIDVICIEISLFNGSQFYVFVVVIEYILVDGEKNFQYINGNKYFVLVYYQYYCCQNWWVYGNVNGRSCVEEVYWVFVFFDVELVVNDFYIVWVYWCFINFYIDMY